MSYLKKTIPHYETVISKFDQDKFDLVWKKRWHIYNEVPIKDISQLCHVARKLVNSDDSRKKILLDLQKKHSRIIVFYNFNYELEILRAIDFGPKVIISEYNGHNHQPVPESDFWVYFVQYMSGAEAWNCITSNTVVFYSQNYSYRLKAQAAGRIDRLNTLYSDLYYYTIRSDSLIDVAIAKALSEKKDFNELNFMKF
jgi:hypothetical protein